MSRPGMVGNDEAAMQIRWRRPGTSDLGLILYTEYKGHNFEGWISTETLRRAEADGALTWDADGRPVIVAAAKAEGRAGRGRRSDERA